MNTRLNKIIEQVKSEIRAGKKVSAAEIDNPLEAIFFQLEIERFITSEFPEFKANFTRIDESTSNAVQSLFEELLDSCDCPNCKPQQNPKEEPKATPLNEKLETLKDLSSWPLIPPRVSKILDEVAMDLVKGA